MVKTNKQVLEITRRKVKWGVLKTKQQRTFKNKQLAIKQESDRV